MKLAMYKYRILDKNKNHLESVVSDNDSKAWLIFHSIQNAAFLEVELVDGNDETQIAELEKDFGVIRAIEKKIKKSFPHHEAINGLIFTNHFELWYENPTFTAGDYNETFVIPQPRWAKFETVGGKWFALETGDYAHRVDEMIQVLISVFGGERG